MEVKTLDISFCDKNALNLVNKEAKEYIMNKLKSYDIDLNYKYANIINKRSIRYLSLQPHLISLKTNGSNYFLFMTKINNLNTCLFIDRKIKQGYSYPRIISIKYSFDDEIFNDTLLDGEIIKDHDNNWMFLIGNIILHKGNLEKTNIITKFNKLYDILSNNYNANDELDICPLRVKKLFTYEEYSKLITQFIPSLTYKIRGLYFNTLNTQHCNHLFIYNNENKTIKNTTIKRKKENDGIQRHSDRKYDNLESDNNLQTFIIRKTEKPDIYELFTLNTNENIGVAYIGKLSISKKIKKYFETNTDNKDIKMSCKYNDNFCKWEPISKID